MEQPGERYAAPESLRLVQDLVNTVDLEGGTEELDTPSALTAWVRGRGIAVGPRGFDRAGLHDVLVLREALRDVCSAHAGADVPPGALAALDGLLAAAPLRLAVDPAGGATVVPVPASGGVAALTAEVAAVIAAAAAEGTWPRLKACAADTCRWVYYDRSPAGRGRWCSMAICGSRAKMRAYRGRK
ncbi:CGNR zinc finger domain-containing protein [Actinacidiphila yanglinensis]|uniref:CGNR zinc finger domain-containing protein n=1 Tax=Actinacidiphila yanglinensis TaxID=310779 RepID=UPI001F4042FA|nr:CGNR zinc finger domain-containing protein [Actinacidiphila yanglinensis]